MRSNASRAIGLTVLAALAAPTSVLATPAMSFTVATTVDTAAGTRTDLEGLSVVDARAGHARLVLEFRSAPNVEMTVPIAADGQITLPFVDEGVECYNLATAFSFWRRTHRDTQRNLEIDLSPNENGLSIAVPMTVSVSNTGAASDPLTVHGEAHGNYSVDGTSTITHDLLFGHIGFARGAIERATFETLLFVGAPLAQLARSHACTLERGFLHRTPAAVTEV